MKESVTYQAIIREGKAKGKAEGKAEERKEFCCYKVGFTWRAIGRGPCRTRGLNRCATVEELSLRCLTLPTGRNCSAKTSV